MKIANMATFPARAAGLESAVSRLAPQVDRLNLCLNEYETTPDWLGRFSNVHAVIPEVDLKDIGKFMFELSSDDDVLLVDDDIAYPDDYVIRSIERRNSAEQAIGGQIVGGYHGTIYLRRSLLRFAKDVLRGRGLRVPHLGRAKILHYYHEALARPRIVAQLGTGTVVLRGAQMPSLDYMLGADRRADVRFARWCHAQSIPQIALPRSAEWMPDGGLDEDAIYATYTQKLPPEFLAELSQFAFSVPRRGEYLS